MLWKFLVRVDVWSVSLESYISPVLFTCTGETDCFCCLNPHTQKGLMRLFLSVFLSFPLKLFIHSFRDYSWNYWIFPLGVPVLRCKCLKGSKDGLPLFGTHCLVFKKFFPDRFPCDSIWQQPSIGLKSNFIFPYISLPALPWILTNANQCNYLWLPSYAFHFHSIHRMAFSNP